MREIRKKHLALAFLAAALGALLALTACGGDDDEPSGSETPAAGTTAPAGETPGATTQPGSNCNPGSGPPQEGLAEGLEGRVSFVRLVFGCQPDIYIMDADGSGATQLTDNPALDDEADLSPDREKVVFSSAREGATSIYVMDAEDGGNLVRLTTGSGDVSPRWSPDGERIAFSQAGSLAVMNADGSDIKVVMPGQRPDTAPTCMSAPIVGGWAPDNRRVVYYEGVPGTTGSSDATPRPDRYNVCAVDVETGEVEVMVSEPAGKLHAEPHWSPDGTMIAFRDDRDGNCFPGAGNCNYEVYVLDIESGEVRNVTNNPALDIEPIWSPDGEWIMFASNRDDVNFDLYVIHPDGTGLQRVLDDPEAKDSYASWR